MLTEEERKAKELELRLRAHARLHPLPKEPYTGPIEDVKPGDILTWQRLDEFEKYIKTKGIKPKRWGRFEDYKDSGARPFAVGHSGTSGDNVPKTQPSELSEKHKERTVRTVVTGESGEIPGESFPPELSANPEINPFEE